MPDHWKGPRLVVSDGLLVEFDPDFGAELEAEVMTELWRDGAMETPALPVELGLKAWCFVEDWATGKPRLVECCVLSCYMEPDIPWWTVKLQLDNGGVIEMEGAALWVWKPSAGP